MAPSIEPGDDRDAHAREVTACTRQYMEATARMDEMAEACRKSGFPVLSESERLEWAMLTVKKHALAKHFATLKAP